MAKVGGVRTAVLAGSLVGALTLSACGSGSSGGSKASSPSGSKQIKLAMAEGSNVFVDTMGLGAPLTGVCAKNPDISCFSESDPAPQAANSRSYTPPDWDMSYLGGVAAGLMTKRNVIGLIGSF